MKMRPRYLGNYGAIAAALSIIVAATVNAAEVGQSPLRGVATQILSDDIVAAIKKASLRPVGENQLRVVSINDEYNVGIGILRHAKQSDGVKFAVEHSEITEIHYFISGKGALLTGGTLKDAKVVPADSAMVSVLDGPSRSGSQIIGGERHLVGPGDVVIVPPNTPHGWENIFSDEIVYLVIKVDPHRVLPAGLGEESIEGTVRH
jgi:hypothetical protein